MSRRRTTCSTAVTFFDFGALVFPAGADLVTIDAYCRRQLASRDSRRLAATLPGGVLAADVTGLRVTFTSSAGTSLTARRLGRLDRPRARPALLDPVRIRPARHRANRDRAGLRCRERARPRHRIRILERELRDRTAHVGGHRLDEFRGARRDRRRHRHAGRRRRGERLQRSARFAHGRPSGRPASWPTPTSTSAASAAVASGRRARPGRRSIGSSISAALPSSVTVSGLADFPTTAPPLIGAPAHRRLRRHLRRARSRSAPTRVCRSGSTSLRMRWPPWARSQDFVNEVRIDGVNDAGAAAQAVRTATLRVRYPQLNVALTKSVTPNAPVPAGGRSIVQIRASTSADDGYVSPTSIEITDVREAAPADDYWQAFDVVAIAPTQVPAGSTLTISTTADGVNWTPFGSSIVAGGVGLLYQSALPAGVVGVRFAFVKSDGFAQGMTVQGNLSFVARATLRDSGLAPASPGTPVAYTNFATVNAVGEVEVPGGGPVTASGSQGAEGGVKDLPARSRRSHVRQELAGRLGVGHRQQPIASIAHGTPALGHRDRRARRRRRAGSRGSHRAGLDHRVPGLQPELDLADQRGHRRPVHGLRQGLRRRALQRNELGLGVRERLPDGDLVPRRVPRLRPFDRRTDVDGRRPPDLRGVGRRPRERPARAADRIRDRERSRPAPHRPRVRAAQPGARRRGDGGPVEPVDHGRPQSTTTGSTARCSTPRR